MTRADQIGWFGIAGLIIGAGVVFLLAAGNGTPPTPEQQARVQDVVQHVTPERLLNLEPGTFVRFSGSHAVGYLIRTEGRNLYFNVSGISFVSMMPADAVAPSITEDDIVSRTKNGMPNPEWERLSRARGRELVYPLF